MYTCVYIYIYVLIYVCMYICICVYSGGRPEAHLPPECTFSENFTLHLMVFIINNIL